MTFEQLYKDTLTEVYKDDLLAWLKNQTATNYYLIVWKDEPVRIVVDRNEYYKYYSMSDNKKKLIATVTSDKSFFASITSVVNIIKLCLNKLNQKLFENAYNKYVANNINASRKDHITFIVDYLSSLDNKALYKFVNYVSNKTYEYYLQSKAYQQHLLRLNHYEQESRTKQLIHQLTNVKAQVNYYKKQSINSASKELMTLKKLISKKPSMNLVDYLDKRLSDLKGQVYESMGN